MGTELDLFACLYVRDLAVAVDWYERLLGAAPSMYPNDTEAVFDLTEHAYLYVEVDEEHAGHSQVTCFLGDLEPFVAAAAERGVEPANRETYDNGVRKITYRDPDGNRVGMGGAPV